MPTGMGVTNPKFFKGGRNLKKTNIAPFHKPWKEMKNERASKIRKESHTLIGLNEKRNTRVESMQKDAQNLMGRLAT